MADEQQQTPGQALQRVIQDKGLAGMLKAYTGNLSRIAPKHIDGESFVALALSYVNKDPKLLAAAHRNPESLVLTLRDAAAKGHAIGPDSYVLVPFNNRRATNGVEVVGIESYKGVVQRMLRSGAVKSVHAELVRAGDPVWQPARGPILPRHEYDWDLPDEERGPIRGAYAWAVNADGSNSHVVVLNRSTLAKYRSLSKAGDNFWGQFPESEGMWTGDMCKKTALHRLEPYVLNTSAFMHEAASVGARATGWHGVPDRPVTPLSGEGLEDIEDAVIVDDGGSQGSPGWPETAQPPDASNANG
jgi:recombination protein RecT